MQVSINFSEGAHGYLQTLPTIQTFFFLVCPLAVSRRSSIDDLYGTAPVLFFNSFFYQEIQLEKRLSFSRTANRKAHFCKQNVNDWKNCPNFTMAVCD